MPPVLATADRPTPIIRFSLFGVPVEVQSSFLFMALLFGAAGGSRSPADVGLWVGIVFVSILWHELGHALVGKLFGSTPRIELNAGGGLTFNAVTDSWWKELLVCLAGPFAGFLLGGLVWAGRHALPDAPWVDTFLTSALYVNIGWGLLNLLPVYPYDGGQAFRAFAVRWLPHGLRIAIGLSLAVAAAGLAYAVYHRRIWLAYLAARGAMLAYQQIREVRGASRLEASYRAWVGGDAAQSEALAREAIGMFSGGTSQTARATAVERIAWAMLARGETLAARTWVGQNLPPGYRTSTILDTTLLLLEGKPGDARTRCEGMDPAMFGMWPVLVAAWTKGEGLDVADLVNRLFEEEIAKKVPRDLALHLSSALFYAGKLEESATVSARAFEAHSAPGDAYNVACSASRLGHLDHALAWLEKAFRAGWNDAKALEEDPDLAAVREEPGFRDLLGKLTPVTS